MDNELCCCGDENTKHNEVDKFKCFYNSEKDDESIF